MPERVAIVGVGCSDVRPTTPDLSYRELIYDAAVRAYADAGVDPRRDVQSFVAVSEDYWEGTSIFDEYVPDQLGAVQRPVQTVGGEGIQGLLVAWMQLQTGLFDCVAVEAHSKLSNVLTPGAIIAFGFDPVLNRPLLLPRSAANGSSLTPNPSPRGGEGGRSAGAGPDGHDPSGAGGLTPHLLAGLEMRRYLDASGATREQCAAVAADNRRAARRNPRGAHAAELAPADVLAAPPLAEPLGALDLSPGSDGAVVVVLATAERARRLAGRPIWLRGGGWATETPSLETRSWGRATYAALAAERAYRQAGIADPAAALDLAEVDDAYSYKQLQHLEALGLAPPGEAGRRHLAGAYALGGELPVNVSGGSLGMGHLLDATGLLRVAELVWQLRGEAGAHQVPGARTGLAFAWRGIPTTTGAAVVLSADLD